MENRKHNQGKQLAKRFVIVRSENENLNWEPNSCRSFEWFHWRWEIGIFSSEVHPGGKISLEYLLTISLILRSFCLTFPRPLTRALGGRVRTPSVFAESLLRSPWPGSSQRIMDLLTLSLVTIIQTFKRRLDYQLESESCLLNPKPECP